MNQDMQDAVARAIAEEQSDMDQIVYAGYTRRELSEAFDKVKDLENWKMPIRGEILEGEYDVTNAAAIFFAGSPLRGVRAPGKPGMVSVYGSGYYENIGA